MHLMGRPAVSPTVPSPSRLKRLPGKSGRPFLRSSESSFFWSCRPLMNTLAVPLEQSGGGRALPNSFRPGCRKKMSQGTENEWQEAEDAQERKPSDSFYPAADTEGKWDTEHEWPTTLQLHAGKAAKTASGPRYSEEPQAQQGPASLTHRNGTEQGAAPRSPEPRARVIPAAPGPQPLGHRTAREPPAMVRQTLNPCFWCKTNVKQYLMAFLQS